MSTETDATEVAEQSPSAQAAQAEQAGAEQQGGEQTTTETSGEQEGRKQERKIPDMVPYKRLSEVVARRNAAEQRAAELERRIAELTGQGGNAPTDDFPDPQKFDSLDNYKKAVREYHERNLDERLRETTQQSYARMQDVAAVQSFNARMAETMKTNPQIVDAVEMFKQMEGDFDPSVFRSIVADPHGPSIVWELATNPELAERLSRATPFQAGRILASIGASAPIQQKPQIQTTQTVSGAARTNKSPSDMTDAEYYAAELAKLKKR